MNVFLENLFSRIQVFFGISLGLFLMTSCNFKLTPKAKVSESSFDSRAVGNPIPVSPCLPEDLGCDGVCNSGKVLDCNQVCDGPGVVDCDGTCNGPAEPDCAGNCNGGAKIDCRGDCNFPADDFDRCGVCGGNGSSCAADPGTIPVAPIDCGFSVPGSTMYFTPPAPGKVCCVSGTVTTWPFDPYVRYRGHSTTEDECCAKGAMGWGKVSGSYNETRSIGAHFDAVFEYPEPDTSQYWRKVCCAMTPKITTTAEALTSIKSLTYPQYGSKSASLTEWNGNTPAVTSYLSGHSCLPRCSRTTQNEPLNGSAHKNFWRKPFACCRVSCTGDDSVDFAYSEIGKGSTCPPTSGVNGNEKGICIPCPECEYKKQLPSVLTPCTHDQLLAERSQGKVPLCEKEPEVCTVPQ